MVKLGVMLCRCSGKLLIECVRLKLMCVFCRCVVWVIVLRLKVWLVWYCMLGYSISVRCGLCLVMVCLIVVSEIVLLVLFGCIFIRYLVGLKLWKWICVFIVWWLVGNVLVFIRIIGCCVVGW